MILDRLVKYSNAIVSGEIIACKKHIKACKRFLDDISKESFLFYFDEVAAQRIIDWFSFLNHSKGILAGKPIILTDWQAFCLCNLYGWINKKTGYRRFTKGFIEVSRKNAKSQILAGCSLYEIAYNSTKNNEVNEAYTAGTKKDQSKIIFEEAKLMLKGSPLADKFKILRTEIVHKKTGSFLKPLSKEDGQKGDGTNPSLGCLDEYHQMTNTEFYDLFDSGMKARREPLLLIITTAGIDLNCPCYTQEYKYCSDILEGTIQNDSYFVMICEIDKDDDISDENNWVKANPIVSSYAEGMKGLRESYQIAKEVPEKMRTFLTKNLNVWVQQRDNGYIDLDKWKKCFKYIDLSTLQDKEIYCGIDLSAKIDLTSVGFVWREGNKYYTLSHSFMPTESLAGKMRTDKVPYGLWANEGYITLTDGNVVDYNFIKQYIKDFEIKNNCKIKEICADPWNATQFINDMQAEGYTCVEIRQGIATLAQPTKEFRDKVYSEEVVHNNNPVLTWAVGNAIVRTDHNENIMLDKSKSSLRIDPIASIINAMVRTMVNEPKKVSIYEDRGMRIL